MAGASQERGEGRNPSPDQQDLDNSRGAAYLKRDDLPYISTYWRPGLVLDPKDISEGEDVDHLVDQIHCYGRMFPSAAEQQAEQAEDQDVYADESQG